MQIDFSRLVSKYGILAIPLLLHLVLLVIVFRQIRAKHRRLNKLTMLLIVLAPVIGPLVYLTDFITTATKFLKQFKSGRYFMEVVTNKEIVSRVLFTILIIVVYRVLANVPLPGIDMKVYQSQFGNQPTSEVKYLLTIFTGGQLETPSIIGLGIGVYITASIIIQLLTSIIPKLEELSKDGARGKQIIDQYTRYLTVPLSVMYSIGFLVLISNQSISGDTTAPIYLISRGADGGISTMKVLMMAAVLTAGSLLMMWLAELVTEKGISNGASLMIMTGILASLPALVANDFTKLDVGAALGKVIQGNTSYLTDPAMIALYMIIGGGFLIVAGVIFVTESTRKVVIQYARRERGGAVQESFLPLKLNQSGVLPIIFASSLLTVPNLILPLLAKITDTSSPIGRFITDASTSLIFKTGTAEHNFVYVIFIIIFSLFYAFIALKPDDVAENLQKSGGFIPGIRPGKSTEDYITKVMIRLTIVGAIFLAVIALIPSVAGATLLNLTAQQFAIFSGIGGTSVLIVVGVVLDTFRQVESYRATQNYEKYI